MPNSVAVPAHLLGIFKVIRMKFKSLFFPAKQKQIYLVVTQSFCNFFLNLKFSLSHISNEIDEKFIVFIVSTFSNLYL